MNAARIRRALLALATLIATTCCGVAGAAITEVGATTAFSTNGGATTLAIAVPSGTVANDVLLVQLAASRNGATITPPAGWAAIRSNGQSFLAVGITQALFYRVATASEPSSYTFGVSTAAGVAGSMIAFRGVDPTSPILGSSGQGGAVLLDTAPSIASCQAGTVQVAFFGFSAGLLGVTLGGGLTPYATTSTNLLVGLTLVNGGATLASAGTCPAYTALAVSATANIGQQVALTPGQPVAGTVYGDANHDAVLGGGEAGIGQTTYVKVASGTPGACASPALQVSAVNPGTGAYSFAAVGAGSYCLIASNNATPSDVTATTPSGFLRTETPGGVRALTVASTAVSGQNFGLYAGSTLAGRAFTDNGAGGGTANDGVANGTEAGVVGATVVASSGATAVASATTDATGAYLLWIPSTANGVLTVAETLPAATLATGGSAGTTAGSYARATNSTSFTFAAGNAYGGVTFGTVPLAVLTTNGAQTVGPGAAVPYAHGFVAGSAGSVTFSTSAASTPAAPWTETIWLDANCNGAVDAGDSAITGPIAVTAGQSICIVVRDASPADAANGAQNVATVSATLAYANAAPALSQTATRIDTTTISTTILLQLALQVRNITRGTTFATANTAFPNDLLEYQLTTTNPATTGVGTVVVGHATPTYTTFVSAACPGALPAGLTACAVTSQPAVGATGAIQWTFTGTLASAASVAVTYQVRIDP